MGEGRHMAVNWVDGMKISRRHFTETDHHHTDQLRQALAAGLTPLTFGLFSTRSGQEPIEMQVSADVSQQIRISIGHLEAIAPDGSMMEIRQEDQVRTETSVSAVLQQYHLPARDMVFYIVLNVNAFERQVSGTPSDLEIPLRHPYTLPGYKISIVPAEFISMESWGGPALIVGKMEYSNTELRTVPDFIPACRIVKDLKALREWYNRFGSFLNEIETCSFRILQKIKTKSQKSSLSDSVQMLVENLVSLLAMNNITFQRITPYESPANMITLLVQVISSVRMSLECLTDREKEELLAYLGEWADEAPGSLEKQIVNAMQVPYNHNEILPGLQLVAGFFQLWSTLFQKLSQLEFIGKRKGQQVFIIESPVHDPPQPEKPKPRWSPI